MQRTPTDKIVPGTRKNVIETTWPYVVYAHTRRVFTEDVLQTAHDEVSCVTQLDSEDEMDFAHRIMDESPVCRFVFRLS